ncbi:hypothetical protein T484DRAFT_1932914 [Baffinella frigidus]|nr:hypothetical protein T484DRAFT_1932914 [Cryptophyta sp. CCMP2293]
MTDALARQGSKGAWTRVVVGAGPRMRIASADAGWLRMFGFSLGEVANKSLAICSGPKTRISIESLVERGAGVPASITFYEKNGSEVVVVVRASRFEDNIAFEMQSFDLFAGCQGSDGYRGEEQDREAGSRCFQPAVSSASVASSDDTACFSKRKVLRSRGPSALPSSWSPRSPTRKAVAHTYNRSWPRGAAGTWREREERGNGYRAREASGGARARISAAERVRDELMVCE